MALSNDILNSFPTITTAQRLWNGLQTRFEGNDEIKEGKKDLSFTQFQMFSYVLGESLSAHLTRFTTLVGKCQSMGIRLSTDQLNKKLLASLPPAWSQICMNLKSRMDVSTESMDNVISSLQAYEMDAQLRQPYGAQVPQVSALMSTMHPMQVNQISGSGVSVELLSSASPSSSSRVEIPQSSNSSSSSEHVDLINKTMSELQINQNHLSLFAGFVSCYDAFVSGRLAPPCPTAEDFNQVNREDLE